MTRAYSLDLRRRVVDAVMSGATVREAAARFGVVPSCVVKWKQRLKATGSLAPGKIGGHRRPILEGEARAADCGKTRPDGACSCGRAFGARHQGKPQQGLDLPESRRA
jgi:transposase